MRAQRARSRGRWIRPQQTVESYEGEGPMVDSPICPDKSSLHEPHVGVEPVHRADAGGGVSACSGQVEIGLPDDAVEVEDRRRVAAGSMGRIGFGIGRGVDTVDAGGKEEVEGAETGRRPGVDMRNRLLLGALFCLAPVIPIVVIMIVMIAEGGRPEAGAEDASGSAGRDTKEVAS